jgi:hypothetical protein
MQDYRRGHYESDERRSRERYSDDRQNDTQRYRQDFGEPRFRGRDDRGYSERYGGESERSWRDQGDGFAESRERYQDRNWFAPTDPEPSDYSSRAGSYGGYRDEQDRGRFGGPRYDRESPGSWRHPSSGERDWQSSGRHQTQAVGGQQWSWGERFGWNTGQQSYAGKGPKNYQRSDERIREEVSDRLTDDHRIDATDVDVEVRESVVTLTGTVRDRDQKRRAEDLAENVSGVKEVTNQIRLARQADEADPSTRSGILGAGPAGSRTKPKVEV